MPNRGGTLCEHTIGAPFYLSLFIWADAHAFRAYLPRTPTTFSCGTCHVNAAGGGARNLFGVDFGRNGQNWQNICPLDSDMDGFTNGAELNDPDCVWRPGRIFNRNDQSRPGDANDMTEPEPEVDAGVAQPPTPDVGIDPVDAAIEEDGAPVDPLPEDMGVEPPPPVDAGGAGGAGGVGGVGGEGCAGGEGGAGGAGGEGGAGGAGSGGDAGDADGMVGSPMSDAGMVDADGRVSSSGGGSDGGCTVAAHQGGPAGQLVLLLGAIFFLLRRRT